MSLKKKKIPHREIKSPCAHPSFGCIYFGNGIDWLD